MQIPIPDKPNKFMRFQQMHKALPWRQSDMTNYNNLMNREFVIDWQTGGFDHLNVDNCLFARLKQEIQS